MFLLILGREEGKERGRDTLMRERNVNRLSPAHPPLGIEPTAQACTLTGTQTGGFLVHGTTPNQVSHMARAWLTNFIKKTLTTSVKTQEDNFGKLYLVIKPPCNQGTDLDTQAYLHLPQ